MDADLISLELKISKLISFCASLRNENSDLREDLITSRQNVKALQDKMLDASNQLEKALQSIPNNDALETVLLKSANSL